MLWVGKFMKSYNAPPVLLVLIAAISSMAATAQAPSAVERTFVVRMVDGESETETVAVAVNSDVVVTTSSISESAAVTLKRGVQELAATGASLDGMPALQSVTVNETPDNPLQLTPLAINDPAFEFDVFGVTSDGTSRSDLGASIMIPGADGAPPALKSPDWLSRDAVTEHGAAIYNACGGLVGLVAPSPDETVIFLTSTDIAQRLSATDITFSIADLCLTPDQEAELALERERARNAELTRKLTEFEKRLAAAESSNERLNVSNDIDKVRKDLESSQETIDLAISILNEENASPTDEGDEPTPQPALSPGIFTMEWVRANKAFVVGAGILVLALLGALVFFILRQKSGKEPDEDSFVIENTDRWDFVLEVSIASLKLPASKFQTGQGIVVGRSREGADVILDKDDVSRRHARFDFFDGGLRVTDLGATNVICVNDQPLEAGTPKRLYEGDRISLGETLFIMRRLMSRS